MSLETVNSLLTPIDCGLKTVESSNVTCSDVLLIYIGIAIGFKQTFQTDGNEIFFLSSNLLTNHSAVDDNLLEHHTDIFNVFNRRFYILMTELTQDMYLLAYFLDLVYQRNMALRLDLPPQLAFSKSISSSLVLQLISAAVAMLKNEQKRRTSGSSDEGKQLLEQLKGMFSSETTN